MTQHVIIVGGGPAGLLTALGLAQAGTRVTVLEAEASLNSSPRALVYHYPVLPHLKRLGILDDCIAAGFVRQDFAWRVHETGELIHWTLKSVEGHAELPYALHLGQDRLSRVVAQHLDRLSNVTIRYSTALTGCDHNETGVRAHVTTASGPETIEGDWLIGADGSSSFVRREVLKLNYFGTTWPERYIATNTRYDFDRHGYSNATMQVDHLCGSVICKIDTNDLWRVTFMEDPTLPMEGLDGRIRDMFAKLLPANDDYEVISQSPYRMHQRVADRMRVGRVALVGDSAHITNPTGGLGLTGGMFDSFALVEALNRIIHDGQAHDILDVYDRDRRQKFIELVSPRASANKVRLYHTVPGTEKDQWVAQTRAIAKSNDAMREAFSFTEQMQTVY